ncbi:hypothetical protein [Desmospora profundinema]|uniref:Lipoprotein n=1 Tax=Desmospora profundinema TaxID=1571184 RepID=A0ABU1IQI2_9BACL|nr:hypothetical protein [Desmospora profundinema]MDR6227045.1 hypothetical protein [Desmospora profundinema]
MKKLGFGVFMALLLLVLSGCGLLTQAGDSKGETNSSKTEEGTSDENSEESEEVGQAANVTGEQPWFAQIRFRYSWEYGVVPRASTGGIWYYTEEKHPGTLDNLKDQEIDWGKVDILHIQLANKEYYGHEIEVLSIEYAEGDLVKVTVRLKPDEDGYQAEENDAARVFIKVEKGSLENKKFIVQTDEGEKLNTN